MQDQRGLQTFLRGLRDTTKPAQVGLREPSGRGRKAVGLSQWQMSELLGWRQGAYARLERGQAKPSEEQLHHVANVLNLDPAQKNTLWIRALGRDLGNCVQDSAANAWLKMIPTLSGESGIGAFVSDLAWNLVVCNAGFGEFFPHCPPSGNLFEWIVWEGAPFLPDHTLAWQRPLLEELDAALARQPDDCKLRALLRKVRADPDLRPVYHSRPWASQAPRHSYPFVVGTRLGHLTMASSVPFASPGHRVVMMRFDADEASDRAGNVAERNAGHASAMTASTLDVDTHPVEPQHPEAG
jgi:transcriptional regulator with XRE-family HTH domain